MADTKPEVLQVENTRHVSGSVAVLAANEDEPQTPYQLTWKTIIALLALSMGNVCAALTNTVCISSCQLINFMNSPVVTVVLFADKYDHQVSSRNTCKIPG